jgi:hypothetical protein
VSPPKADKWLAEQAPLAMAMDEPSVGIEPTTPALPWPCSAD